MKRLVTNYTFSLSNKTITSGAFAFPSSSTNMESATITARVTLA